MIMRLGLLPVILLLTLALSAQAQTNQPPVLAPIGSQSTTEDVLLSFSVTATDAESIPTLTTSALPGGAIFTDNLNGTGSFSWTPDLTQAGIYNITFYATDDSLAIDLEDVQITVNESGNQPPILNPIGPLFVAEGGILSVVVSATDVESIPALSTSTLWFGAVFSDNGDGSGLLEWEPDYTQSGTYYALFFATDDSLAADTEVVAITVTEVGNQLPLLDPIGSQSTTEGFQLVFGVSASDAESIPALSSSTLPPGATFIDHLNGTGSFDWTPDFSQSGSYPVTFYATDDSAQVDSEAVVLTVNEAGNQMPVLAAIGIQSSDENELLSFAVTASDAESIPALTSSSLPAGATFIDNLDGTGSFDWTPTFLQSGSYNVTFYATDDSLAVDSENVSIFVTEVGNQMPVLAAIGTKTTTDTARLVFPVSATDAESVPSLSASPLPAGVLFTDNGNGTGVFDWTPDFDQSGFHLVTFYATDDSLAVDSERITIWVTEVGNQTPTLDPIGSQSITEGEQLVIPLSASDPEDIPSLTSTTLPAGAILTDNGDGTGSVVWTPSFVQSSVYAVTFYATDDSATVDQEAVSITVIDAGNQQPVLASIGSQTVDENQTLSFALSAGDGESIPVLSSSALPTGAIFTDNLDGTGSFDWTPNFTQSGTYNVTFYATDDSLAIDSEAVSISVAQINLPPILATIGGQSVTEGIMLTMAVSSSDPDGTLPYLTTSALPSGAVFVDSGNGAGSLIWTPDFFQSGTYYVTFYATDDSTAVDSEVVAISVTEAGNQQPVLVTIGGQATDENELLSFALSASDGESIPVLTSTALPTGASFTDNLDGTGSFDWMPTFVQSGTYNVTFYATDDSLAIDSELVSITVVEVGNQEPVLASIGGRSVNENVLLSFVISSTDAESTPALTSSSLPGGATFTDNADGTGTFDWTPTFIQSGTYSVTFYATDDSLSIDSEIVSITVNEVGNQPPVLTFIGSQSTNEDVLLSIAVSAGDPESVPALTSSSLPSGASFTDNLDGTGSFSWTPTFIQSGTYNVTFFATDDSLVIDSEVVTITINDMGNQSPVLASIGFQSTNENVLLNFSVSAGDPESIPSLSSSTLPAGASFTDNLDGTGSFDWTPTFVQSDLYVVTFYATDDSSAVDSEAVLISVADAGNQPPLLAAIGGQSTDENVALSFSFSATDAENIPTFSSSPLPSGAVLTDNLDGTGSFDWTPDFTQSGTYYVTFFATDDSLALDSEVVSIIVAEVGNQLPLLAAIGSQATDENVFLSFGLTAVDPESVPTLTSSTLPAGAVLTDNLDGTGSFDWTPDYTQSGTYDVTFYATDDSLSVDSELVSITVAQVNLPPILAPIGPQSIVEGATLNLGLSSTDPDGTIPVLTVSSLPSGASFIDSGNGSGSVFWTPDFVQSGVYSVTVYSTDDSTAVDSEVVSINVIEAGNQMPVLAAIGSQSTGENAALSFSISATDAESVPTLTTSSLPTGVLFTDNLDGSGSFDWTPTFVQSGIYDITFYATDDSLAIDSELVSISVTEVGNQSPVLSAIGSKSTTEGIQVAFGITAADAESIPTLSTSSLPPGALFNDNLDGTGSFDWTPDFLQSGTYAVTFYATDDSLVVDSEIVAIVVNDAGNQSPVLALIGGQSVNENVLLSFPVTATDAESLPLLSTSALPSGAIFTDNLDGTGSFDWTPEFVQAGTYEVTFFAVDDSSQVDSEVVTITVVEVGNQMPVLTFIGSQSISENQFLTFALSAGDAESVPMLSSSSLPTGAALTDNLDGTGSFSWTPTFIQSGTYDLTFYATDDSSAVDSEVVTITVNEVGNQMPTLSSIGAQSITEGAQLAFALLAGDAESVPSITSSALPAGAILIDNNDGSGSFDWTPDFTQSGTYDVTFYATDDSLAIDSELVTISVSEAGNQSPVLSPIGVQAVDEDELLSFTLAAFDGESIPTLTSSSLPAGAVLTDNSDGTGSFYWTPDFTQSGTYNVTFYATDDSLVIDSEIVSISVAQVNLPPELGTIGEQSVMEGINLSFAVSTSDPDGNIPVLTISTPPAGVTFIDSGNGAGSFDWTPTFFQSGTYYVTFYTTDDSLAADSEVVTIIVSEAGNQLPLLASIGSQSTSENVTVNFALSAVDAESIPTLSSSGLPTGATLTDNLDGSGSFDWTPDFTQSGTYDIIFYATDDSLAIDSEIVSITVAEVGNQLPILDPIGPQSTLEGVQLAFTVTSSDAESIPVLTTSVLPSGASFTDNLDGTGSFDWTPGIGQTGNYSVTFYATDDSLVVDSETVLIVVGCCDVAGDFDGSGSIDIADLTASVAFMFTGGAAPDCLNDADVDANCAVDIADITYRVNYLFGGGPILICGCALK